MQISWEFLKINRYLIFYFLPWASPWFRLWETFILSVLIAPLLESEEGKRLTFVAKHFWENLFVTRAARYIVIKLINLSRLSSPDAAGGWNISLRVCPAGGRSWTESYIRHHIYYNTPSGQTGHRSYKLRLRPNDIKTIRKLTSWREVVVVMTGNITLQLHITVINWGCPLILQIGIQTSFIPGNN